MAAAKDLSQKSIYSKFLRPTLQDHFSKISRMKIAIFVVVVFMNESISVDPYAQSHTCLKSSS